MTSLQELRERIGRLTGPDRETDMLIWGALLEDKRDRWSGWSFWITAGGLPHFTASLDAAVALVERVLPGWNWLLRNDNCLANLWAPGTEPNDGDACYPSWAGTPVLALLLALLDALSSAPTPGGEDNG
jgi:hypothetical protein